MQSSQVRRTGKRTKNKGRGSVVPFILLIFAIVAGTCLLFGNGTGAAGKAINGILCSAFGIAAYLIAPMLILLGFFFDDFKNKGTVAAKSVMTVLAVVFFAAFFSIAGTEGLKENPLDLKNCAELGKSLTGGGAVGGLAGKLLSVLFGKAFGAVLAAIIAIGLVSFVIGSDFFGIWKTVFGALAVKAKRKRPMLDPKENVPKGRTPAVKPKVINTTVVELPADKGIQKINTAPEVSVNLPKEKGTVDPFAYGDMIGANSEENSGNVFVEIRDDNGEYDPKYDELSSYRPEEPVRQTEKKLQNDRDTNNTMGPGGGYSPFSGAALFAKRAGQTQNFANNPYGNNNQNYGNVPAASGQQGSGAYSPFSDPMRSMDSDPIIAGSQKRVAEKRAAEEEARERQAQQIREEELLAMKLQAERAAEELAAQEAEERRLEEAERAAAEEQAGRKEEYQPVPQTDNSFSPFSDPVRRSKMMDEYNRKKAELEKSNPKEEYPPEPAEALPETLTEEYAESEPEYQPVPQTDNSFSPFSDPVRRSRMMAEQERNRQKEEYPAESGYSVTEAPVSGYQNGGNGYQPVPQSDNSFSPFSDPVRRSKMMDEYNQRKAELEEKKTPARTQSVAYRTDDSSAINDIMKISEAYVRAEDSGAFVSSAHPAPSQETQKRSEAGNNGGLYAVSGTSGMKVTEVTHKNNDGDYESLRSAYGNVSDADGDMPDEEEIAAADAEMSGAQTRTYQPAADTRIVRQSAQPQPAPQSAPQTAQPYVDEPVTEEELEIARGRGDKSKPRYPNYVFPSLQLLNPPSDGEKMSEEEIMSIKNSLLGKLKSFGLEATLSGYCIGPTITRYELAPGDGVKVSSIIARSEDIALALSADGVRIAPVSGKSVVGVEVPNKKVSSVALRTLLEKDEFQHAKSKITVCVGVTVSGKPIYMDIDDMPHVLIAGQTKSGKSVAINCMILSLLYRATPDEVQLILIDPKMVEFSIYADIPHLVMPIIDEPNRAAAALQWAVDEMERRYQIMKKLGVRNRDEYCELKEEEPQLEILPQIVIVIDELADLMIRAKDQVEDLINRLAAKARACGIHLLVGTQRPSVDVVTGLIKANIPARIAFKVAANTDSKIILDSVGAEKLLGRGDMLFQPTGCPKVRVQGAYVGGSEIRHIMGAIIDNNGGADYDPEVLTQLQQTYEKLTKAETKKGSSDDEEDGIVDCSDVDYEYLCKAIEMILDKETITSNAIQRGLRVGFNRAADITDRLENLGFISKRDGTKPRNVLVDRAMYDEFRANHGQ